MVLISKKRLMFVAIVVVCSIFSFSLFRQIDRENNLESTQTVALPVSNKVVVLDAGHGSPDNRSYKFQWNLRK